MIYLFDVAVNNLIERVIRALSLLDMLVRVGWAFPFKACVPFYNETLPLSLIPEKM